MEQTASNLSGALIFWMYIVLALVFTILIIDGIYRRPLYLPPSGLTYHARLAAYFTVLATISFATLSFNMLHVLISSYQTWSLQHFPTQSTASTLSVENIWHWSLGSTLFQDFGNAIVEDAGRYVWTQSALLVTFGNCLFMAFQGHRRGIRRLWAFFALSQILPISFAQNLFYISMLRSGPPSENAIIRFPRNRFIGTVAGYCACLVAAPYAFEGKYLMPTILVTRVLLLLPYFLLRIERMQSSNVSRRRVDHEQAQLVFFTIAAALMIRQVYLAVQAELPLSEIMGASLSHPAVTSLSADFLVSICSLQLLYISRRWVSDSFDQGEGKMSKAS